MFKKIFVITLLLFLISGCNNSIENKEVSNKINSAYGPILKKNFNSLSYESGFLTIFNYKAELRKNNQFNLKNATLSNKLVGCSMTSYSGITYFKINFSPKYVKEKEQPISVSFNTSDNYKEHSTPNDAYKAISACLDKYFETLRKISEDNQKEKENLKTWI